MDKEMLKNTQPSANSQDRENLSRGFRYNYNKKSLNKYIKKDSPQHKLTEQEIRYQEAFDIFSCKNLNKKLRAKRYSTVKNSDYKSDGFDTGFDMPVTDSANLKPLNNDYQYKPDTKMHTKQSYGEAFADYKRNGYNQRNEDTKLYKKKSHGESPADYNRYAYMQYKNEPKQYGGQHYSETNDKNTKDELAEVLNKTKPVLVSWNKISSCFVLEPWKDDASSKIPKSREGFQSKLYPNQSYNWKYNGGYNTPRAYGVLCSPNSSCTELNKITSYEDYWQPIYSHRGKKTKQGQNKSNMTIYSEDSFAKPSLGNITAVSQGNNKSNTTIYSIDRFENGANGNKTNITARSQGKNKSNMTIYSYDLSDVSAMNLSSRTQGRNKSNITIYSLDVSHVPQCPNDNGLYRNGSLINIFDEIVSKTGGMRLSNELKKLQLLNSTREELENLKGNT